MAPATAAEDTPLRLFNYALSQVKCPKSRGKAASIITATLRDPSNPGPELLTHLLPRLACGLISDDAEKVMGSVRLLSKVLATNHACDLPALLEAVAEPLERIAKPAKLTQANALAILAYLDALRITARGDGSLAMPDWSDPRTQAVLQTFSRDPGMNGKPLIVLTCCEILGMCAGRGLAQPAGVEVTSDAAGVYIDLASTSWDGGVAAKAFWSRAPPIQDLEPEIRRAQATLPSLHPLWFHLLESLKIARPGGRAEQLRNLISAWVADKSTRVVRFGLQILDKASRELDRDVAPIWSPHLLQYLLELGMPPRGGNPSGTATRLGDGARACIEAFRTHCHGAIGRGLLLDLLNQDAPLRLAAKERLRDGRLEMPAYYELLLTAVPHDDRDTIPRHVAFLRTKRNDDAVTALILVWVAQVIAAHGLPQAEIFNEIVRRADQAPEAVARLLQLRPDGGVLGGDLWFERFGGVVFPPEAVMMAADAPETARARAVVWAYLRIGLRKTEREATAMAEGLGSSAESAAIAKTSLLIELCDADRNPVGPYIAAQLLEAFGLSALQAREILAGLIGPPEGPPDDDRGAVGSRGILPGGLVAFWQALGEAPMALTNDGLLIPLVEGSLPLLRRVSFVSPEAKGAFETCLDGAARADTQVSHKQAAAALGAVLEAIAENPDGPAALSSNLIRVTLSRVHPTKAMPEAERGVRKLVRGIGKLVAEQDQESRPIAAMAASQGLGLLATCVPGIRLMDGIPKAIKRTPSLRHRALLAIQIYRWILAPGAATEHADDLDNVVMRGFQGVLLDVLEQRGETDDVSDASDRPSNANVVHLLQLARTAYDFSASKKNWNRGFAAKVAAKLHALYRIEGEAATSLEQDPADSLHKRKFPEAVRLAAIKTFHHFVGGAGQPVKRTRRNSRGGGLEDAKPVKVVVT